MTNKFLLMSQNTELTQQLTTLCKKARWTGLLAKLQHQPD